MSEPVPENPRNNEILDFCKKILRHIKENPALTASEKYGLLQQILYMEDDPDLFVSMTDEGEIMFALIDDDKRVYRILDMDRYAGIVSAFEGTEIEYNVKKKLELYMKMKQLSENNRFCSIQDINQTCHKYKYEIITADGDMIDLNLQNNDKNTLMPIYNALRLNIMFIYKMGRWAFNQRTFTPQGLKDIRVTYVKEDTIFTYDLPSLNFFEGFFVEATYEQCHECQICYEIKFKQLLECGNCKKGICKTCFDQIKTVTCSYCRYHIHDHLHKRIRELGVEDLVIKINEIKMD